MNPSASGWVTKFGHILKDKRLVLAENMALFNQLKSLGFLYGLNIAIPEFIITEHEASIDERTKINLIFAMHSAYEAHFNRGSLKESIQKAIRVFIFVPNLTIPSLRRCPRGGFWAVESEFEGTRGENLGFIV